MAFITLTGRREPIDVPNHTALRIKNSWVGNGASKADNSEVVDLDWITFSFGQIKSIELTREHTSDLDYNRPLTKGEQRRAADLMARTRAALEAKGVIVRPFSTNQR